jgi:hypothetical protein
MRVLPGDGPSATRRPSRIDERARLSADAPCQLFRPEPMYIHGTTVALITAGSLRALGSFVPGTTSPGAAVQLLYLLTDICILLGFIGWYAAIHQAAGATGFVAFVLGVVGILMIRSSAAFPNVDLYPPGALVFEVGLNALALAAWKTRRLPAWIASLLLLSVIAGAASYTSAELSWLLILSGVLFGIGLAGVGLSVRPAPRAPAQAA